MGIELLTILTAHQMAVRSFALPLEQTAANVHIPPIAKVTTCSAQSRLLPRVHSLRCRFLKADIIFNHFISAMHSDMIERIQTFGGVAGSIPIAAITLLIVINFLTFLSLLGKSIRGDLNMEKSSKVVRKEKNVTSENNKATKHLRFYQRYISQFIEITVSIGASVMAAGSACLILNVGAASRRGPR